MTRREATYHPARFDHVRSEGGVGKIGTGGGGPIGEEPRGAPGQALRVACAPHRADEIARRRRNDLSGFVWRQQLHVREPARAANVAKLVELLSRPLVKVCGLTREEDVAVAVEAGPPVDQLTDVAAAAADDHVDAFVTQDFLDLVGVLVERTLARAGSITIAEAA